MSFFATRASHGDKLPCYISPRTYKNHSTPLNYWIYFKFILLGSLERMNLNFMCFFLNLQNFKIMSTVIFCLHQKRVVLKSDIHDSSTCQNNKERNKKWFFFCFCEKRESLRLNDVCNPLEMTWAVNHLHHLSSHMLNFNQISEKYTCNISFALSMCARAKWRQSEKRKINFFVHEMDTEKNFFCSHSLTDLTLSTNSRLYKKKSSEN